MKGSPCDRDGHKPSLTLTESSKWVHSIICLCSVCGEMHEFPVGYLPKGTGEPVSRHLRAVK